MKHSNHTSLLIFSVFLLSLLNAFTCDTKFKSCIRGEGAAVNENRSIDGVSRISLQSFAHLNITKGDAYACNISGQKNILDNLVFSREGDKLIISEKDCVKDNTDVTINITVPSLSMVKLGGSGDINVSGAFEVPAFEAALSGSGNIRISNSISAGSLKAEISGSGDINMRGAFKTAESKISGSGSISISGSCDNSSISISGSGDVHAFGFTTLSTDIHASGSGNSEVNAGNALNVKISGSGDVWYQGNPVIIEHISGSGSINRKATP